MKAKEPKHFIIPCIPVALMNKEQVEKEQPDCQEIECPRCFKSMWISKKKRDILNNKSEHNKDIEEYDEIIVACWNCIKDEMKILSEAGLEVKSEMRNI